MNKENIVTFFDAVGRTIFGESIPEKSCKDWLVISNPVVVHAQPNPATNQMALQLFPAFFREFLADKSQAAEFKYYRKNIAVAEGLVLDFRLVGQYTNMFEGQGGVIIPTPEEVAATSGIIKLFDE